MSFDRGDAQRDDFPAAILTDPHISPQHGTVLLSRLVDSRAEFEEQALASHFEQVQGRRSRGRLEVEAASPAKLNDFHILIDEHRGRGVLVDQDVVRPFFDRLR